MKRKKDDWKNLYERVKIPKKNNFLGNEIKKVPYKYTDTDTCLKGIYARFEHGCGQLWNGKPQAYSTYA